MSDTKTTAPAKPEPQVKVKLEKHHRHAGEDLKPGDELTVREGLAKWMVENGIAKIVKS